MLSSCLFFNSSNTTNALGVNLRNDLTIPSLVICIATLFLSGLILMALVSSKCYNSSYAMFYLNLTVADAIMAFIGVCIIVNPKTPWLEYEKIALVLLVLRYVLS